jgi:hypothetical protein
MGFDTFRLIIKIITRIDNDRFPDPNSTMFLEIKTMGSRNMMQKYKKAPKLQ